MNYNLHVVSKKKRLKYVVMLLIWSASPNQLKTRKICGKKLRNCF